MAIFRSHMPWEFAAANCRDFFAVVICHSYLPWKFAKAICREKLTWLFVEGLFCACKEAFFLCEQILFFVSKSFLIERKPFSYVSKTFYL